MTDRDKVLALRRSAPIISEQEDVATSARAKLAELRAPVKATGIIMSHYNMVRKFSRLSEAQRAKNLHSLGLCLVAGKHVAELMGFVEALDREPGLPKIASPEEAKVDLIAETIEKENQLELGLDLEDESEESGESNPSSESDDPLPWEPTESAADLADPELDRAGIVYNQGAEAFDQGLALTDCTYAVGTLLQEMWTNGFNDRAEGRSKVIAVVGIGHNGGPPLEPDEPAETPDAESTPEEDFGLSVDPADQAEVEYEEPAEAPDATQIPSDLPWENEASEPDQVVVDFTRKSRGRRAMRG